MIKFEKVEKDAKKIEEKSIRIAKIAVLQNTLDKDNGGDVAENALDHLYTHIRYALLDE